MRSLDFVLSLVFGLFLDTSKAVRILGIFPLAAKSHFSCNEAIMKSLHATGHQVTMVSPFPSETKIDNFTYIDSRFDTFIYIGQSSMQELNDLHLGYLMDMMTGLDTQYCYDVMKLKEIQDMLNSTEKLFDVMFVELLVSYECYLPIAQKLGIPVIGTVTLRSWKQADRTIGIPNNPAVIPLEMIASKPRMSLVERFENLWNNIFVDYHYRTTTRAAIEKFYREHFNEDLLFKKEISLVFINNHPTLLPRPTIPNAIEIGGIHLKPAKPLPEDLRTFVDKAPHGVIVFSFGSVVKGSSLPSKQRQIFLAAFASIPQRVVWKYEEEIENLPKNIMLSSWLPQRDILASGLSSADASWLPEVVPPEAVHDIRMTLYFTSRAAVNDNSSALSALYALNYASNSFFVSHNTFTLDISADIHFLFTGFSEHKNVIVFISHCGQSGVYEAIATGTPVVTIPLFVDQQSNAALLHDRGVGVHVDLKTITKEKLLAALNTIINDTSYYQRMQELSRVFKDRPLTPQQSIVYWTEYVARYNGAPYLKALGSDMSLFQYLMLDILSLALIAASVAFALIYLSVKKIYAVVTRKREYEISNKKEK